jgi:hypothetical protein
LRNRGFIEKLTMESLLTKQGKEPFIWNTRSQGKTLISFRKGSDSMFFVLLHPNVPTSSQGFEEDEVQEPIRKVLVLKRDKNMTMFSMLEKEEARSRKLAILQVKIPERDKGISNMIRIQSEDVKGKVRAISPAAMQFIGPGDYE